MTATTETTGKKIVKTACQFCIGCCGMDVHLEGDRIVKVTGMKEHPVSRGRLCPKGAAILDYVYHPDRLLYPLKKERGSWHRIFWDEALDTITAKLKEIKESYGPQALALVMGFPQISQGIGTQGLIRRFFDVYGAANSFSVESLCFRTRLISYILTCGKYAIADPENARCIILWGHNPTDSNPAYSWFLEETLKKNKPKLIVIDPRRTALARKADIHVQPRPGSDCALALGLLHVILNEGLYDRDFVARWTVGFEELASQAQRYPPEEVERITWVPAQAIRDIARTYATTRPACIVQGTNTLDQQVVGVQNTRLIASLQAITGNFDVRGGAVTSSALHLNPVRLPDKVAHQPLGLERFPLFHEVFGRVFGESQAVLLYDALLTGKPYPIKALMVSASNPLLSWPNSQKVQRAFGKLDFLVVMDLFMTETAERADIVLPAASFLERTDLCDLTRLIFPYPYVILRKKVIQVGECWPDLKFWIELGKRMGYGEYFPWKDDEEAIDYLLQPSGLSVKYLTEEKPSGLHYGEVRERQYEKRGFPTPSGKVELYSETLQELGNDPVPAHREPPESPISTPKLARDYPLILTTGSRVQPFVHSQHRNIPRLRRRMPHPVVEVHPTTGAKYGLEDGELAVVETKRGSIEVRARFTEDILAEVVNISHGWAEANVNLLTAEAPGDPVTGNPVLKAMLCLCRLRKKEE